MGYSFVTHTHKRENLIFSLSVLNREVVNLASSTTEHITEGHHPTDNRSQYDTKCSNAVPLPSHHILTSPGPVTDFFLVGGLVEQGTGSIMLLGLCHSHAFPVKEGRWRRLLTSSHYELIFLGHCLTHWRINGILWSHVIFLVIGLLLI